MRTYDNGCFFTVAASEREVADFASKWPCFGEPKSLWFQFDKRNGDLTDLGPNDDGLDSAGVAALAADCKAVGIKRLKLALRLRQYVAPYPA